MKNKNSDGQVGSLFSGKSFTADSEGGESLSKHPGQRGNTARRYRAYVGTKRKINGCWPHRSSGRQKTENSLSLDTTTCLCQC